MKTHENEKASINKLFDFMEENAEYKLRSWDAAAIELVDDDDLVSEVYDLLLDDLIQKNILLEQWFNQIPVWQQVVYLVWNNDHLMHINDWDALVHLVNVHYADKLIKAYKMINADEHAIIVENMLQWILKSGGKEYDIAGEWMEKYLNIEEETPVEGYLLDYIRSHASCME